MYHMSCECECVVSHCLRSHGCNLVLIGAAVIHMWIVCAGKQGSTSLGGCAHSQISFCNIQATEPG